MSEHAEVKQEHSELLARLRAIPSIEGGQFLADHDAEVERKVLERVYKMVCYKCSEGEAVGFDEVTGHFYHKNEAGYFYNSGFCRADVIRIAAKSQKGGT